MNATTRLVLLAADPVAPSTCLLLDAQGTILERGEFLADTLASMTSAPRTVVAVPGEQVLTRRLQLPLRNPAHAHAAALLQLDEELASEGPPHLALGDVDANGYRLACVVDAATMRAWLARLDALDIVADVLLPDHLLLPPSTDDRAFVVSLSEHRLVRGPMMAFSAESTLADSVLAAHPHQTRIIGEESLSLLARGALHPPLDLQQGTFARRRSDDPESRRIRRLPWLIGLLLASPLVLVAVDALRHELSAELLHRRARTLASAVAEQKLAQSDPVSAVNAQLARLRGASGFNALSHSLLLAVQAQPGVRIERIDYDIGKLGATLAHTDAEAGIGVLNALHATGVEATLENAGREGDSARSRIALEAPR